MTAGASSPPGYLLTSSSVFTDSALPGRKEAVSFCSASSSLPAKAPPTAPVISRNTARTTNLARRPAGMVRILATYGAYGRGFSSAQQRFELVRLGHRPPAHEALADIGGGAAVDRLAPLEQRHAVGVAARQHDVRAEARAHDALERAAVGPHQRDLADGGDVEVDRLQQVAERGRVLRGERVQQPDRAERGLLVAVLARERGEPQQPERRRRLAGRDRVVLDVLAARDQLLVVVGGREEAAVLGGGGALYDRVGECPRLGEPARVEGRLVER